MSKLVFFAVLLCISQIMCQTCDPPCVNGGTCLVNNACQCQDNGWTGYRCEVAICSSGCGPGQCIGPNTCNCTGTQFTGANCSIPICDPGCQNGGRCVGPNACDCTGTGFTAQLCDYPICSKGCGAGVCVAPEVCNCTNSGYEGNNCEIPICNPPCVNGKCVGPNGCNCNGTGYIGEFCEIPVCSPGCQNMGVCDYPNHCNCSGLVGWTGDYCEKGICDVPCQHGGICSAPNECNCANTGYAGKYCDVEVNECLLTPSPCDPMATCTNTVGNFTCTCPPGYRGGKISEGGCVDIDECKEGKCDPLAPCQNTNGSFICGACPAGYVGTGLTGCNATCDSKCKNNATCGNTDRCQCKPGWNGTYCELDINECAAGKCDPLVTCTNLPGSFTCGNCPTGYTGTGYTKCVKSSGTGTTDSGVSTGAPVSLIQNQSDAGKLVGSVVLTTLIVLVSFL